MAINARWTNCPAYLKAKDTESGSDEWAYFNNLSYVLSMALVGVEFPQANDKIHDTPWAITEENWEEVFLRISVWEHIFGALRVGWENDDDVETSSPKDLPFKPDEIKSMIGMSVNAGSQTDYEFGIHVYRVMKQKAQDKLTNWLRNQDDGE